MYSAICVLEIKALISRAMTVASVVFLSFFFFHNAADYSYWKSVIFAVYNYVAVHFVSCNISNI